MMSHNGWVITVVAPGVNWRKATAAALVREAGMSPRVAGRWSKVRREMNPAGLKRKIAATRN